MKNLCRYTDYHHFELVAQSFSFLLKHQTERFGKAYNLRIKNEIPFFLGKRDLTCWLRSKPSDAFNTNIKMDKFLHVQDHPQKHWNSKPVLFQTIIRNWNPQRYRTVAENMHDIIADHTRNKLLMEYLTSLSSSIWNILRKTKLD